MDAAAAAGIWAEVKGAMVQIYEKNARSLYFEQVFRNAYNLVLYKHGGLLYNGVHETIKAHLTREAERVASTPNEHLLAEVLKGWEQHKTATLIFKDVFLYLDRVYVREHNKVEVYSLGLRNFRDVVLYHPGIRLRLQTTLLYAVHDERAGNIIDRDVMRSVLNMLLELSGIDGINVYHADFEKPFLKETEAFYCNESQKYLSQNSCTEYLLKSEQRVAEESERVTHYLAASTEEKLSEILLKQLIANHAVALLNMETSGLNWMLQADKLEDLKRLYSLFAKVPSTLDALRAGLGEFTKRCGFEIVAKHDTAPDPVGFIQEALALETKVNNVLNTCFRAEKKAEKKLQDAFDEFLNKDTRGAKYLSLYLDSLMRGDMKDIAADDVDATVERVVSIFRHVQDKDVFENFYRTHFAKRLLTRKSVSEESERQVLTHLQKECGHQYVTKLHGMFTDMKDSRKKMEAYLATEGSSGHAVELDVSVLTTGHWPVTALPTCELPVDVRGVRDAFQYFYTTAFGGRKLTWQTNMGSAVMKANFPLGKRELNLSTYQMCMLMLFNVHEFVTLETVRQACNIPEVEMRRHLLSLCTPKLRLVLKSPKGKGIEDDDTFKLNKEFTHKMRRIKVPLISAKEVVPFVDTRRVPETVEEDRRHLIEAAIVRVMKARRQLNLNDLVAEVTRQLSHRFTPLPQVIKKRIESLIEREFIERNEEDRRFFNYIA